MKNSARIQTIKKTHPFRLWDLCVYALIAVAVVLLLVAASQPRGDSVRITYYDLQGKKVAVVKQLDKNDVFEPPVPEGAHYKIVIEDGKAWISESDCKDKICIGMGKISRVNQQIVCLPYRITVTITGDSGADAAIS